MPIIVKIPAPVQTTAVVRWALSEENMKAALIEARGDIFVASQMLGVTALRLDRALKISTTLRDTQSSILQAKSDPDFDKLSTEQLESEIQHRFSLYRVAGIDSLYELATMPIDENSAQNQVKLAAAARLAGSTEGLGGGGDVADTLRALNEAYHQNAPRIRVVRERISVEVGQPERVIDQTGS